MYTHQNRNMNKGGREKYWIWFEDEKKQLHAENARAMKCNSRIYFADLFTEYHYWKIINIFCEQSIEHSHAICILVVFSLQTQLFYLFKWTYTIVCSCVCACLKFFEYCKQHEIFGFAFLRMRHECLHLWHMLVEYLDGNDNSNERCDNKTSIWSSSFPMIEFENMAMVRGVRFDCK